MFRQLTICDVHGNPVNTFNPENLYLKWDIGDDVDENAVDSILNTAEDFSEYYAGEQTFYIKSIMFSLGSGTGNDNWNLYTGQYENSGSANTITGLASDGTLSISNYAEGEVNNKQLPYYYHWNKDNTIGSNPATSEGIFLPQSRVTIVEFDENNPSAVIINIKRSDWSNLFTENGISWQSHRFNSSIVGNGYDLETGSYGDCTLAITNGQGWNGCEYPSWSSSETLFIPYDLLDGKDISFGIEIGLGTEVGDTIESIETLGSFSGAALSEFHPWNLGLVPNLQFSQFDPIGLGEIYISETGINVLGGEGITSTSVNESLDINFQFRLHGFLGQVNVCAFDHNNIGAPEYANIFGSTLMHIGYNEIDDMANYGDIDFEEEGNPFGETVEVHHAGHTNLHEASFSYTPTGQVGSDSFSIYIILNQLSETTPQITQDAFNNLEPHQKILFARSITMNVQHEGSALTDEEYEPSEVLVENPSDIMFHLAEQELGYDKDINADKIVNARNNQYDFKLGFSVNEEIEGKKLFQEIAQSSKCVPTFNNGMLSFAYIQDTYTKTDDLDSIFTINAQDVINHSFSRTKLKDIKTKVQVKYDYDYGRDSFLKSVDRSAYNFEGIAYSPDQILMSQAYGITGRYGDISLLDGSNLPKINYYGLKYDKDTNKLNHQDTFLSIENKYIRHKETAEKLAEHLVYLQMNVHNVIDLTLPLKYYNLEIGDLCDFNEMILGKKIYSESYVLSSPDDMPIRCGQYILPLFMVTGVTKTIKNVKVKLIQMHHNSNSALNWDGQTYPSYAWAEVEEDSDNITDPDNIIAGDTNQDGNFDVLDIVQITSHILGTQELPFLQYGDYNEDGIVDVLDIVGIVNNILGE